MMNFLVTGVVSCFFRLIMQIELLLFVRLIFFFFFGLMDLFSTCLAFLLNLDTGSIFIFNSY